MDDYNYRPAAMRDSHLFENAPGEEAPPTAGQPAGGVDAGGASSIEPAAHPAVAKFKSCRWRATPEQGEFCTHRDVLPFAGKEGFKPESWCPECAFYKLRRTPKKRERIDYSY